MIFNAENILLIGSILLFVSIVVSKTGYRFGIPTLLVFIGRHAVRKRWSGTPVP